MPRETVGTWSRGRCWVFCCFSLCLRMRSSRFRLPTVSQQNSSRSRVRATFTSLPAWSEHPASRPSLGHGEPEPWCRFRETRRHLCRGTTLGASCCPMCQQRLGPEPSERLVRHLLRSSLMVFSSVVSRMALRTSRCTQQDASS